MVEAIAPQPGHVVLELAAGPGDTGFMAAELIRPGGRLITTDGAEAMLDVARERAQELGIENVEFTQMEAEWIDMGAASVDGVLCRWGYMLLVDPEAALRDTRRVLRPGGRVALAAWDRADLNPLMTVGMRALRETPLWTEPDPDAPGPFSFSEPGHIEELLGATGFTEVQVEAIDLEHRLTSLDHAFETQTELSPGLRAVLSARAGRVWDRPAQASELPRRP
jgi:SAM-dependent methyltransferase